MDIKLQILLITSTFGALQSFFFGIYLFTIKKGKSLANVFLALLLVVFAARIIKSVGYYFASGHVIPDLLMNIGFGCNLAIFPLLWLYLNAFLRKDYQFDWRWEWVHLLPAAAALMLSTVLTDEFWIRQWGYTVSLLCMLIYLPFCIRVAVKHFGSLGTIRRVWVISLIGGIAAVWMGYLANYIFGLVPYITGPVLFSILVFLLSFLGLKRSSLFTSNIEQHRSSYRPVQVESCYKQLIHALETSKVFKDASLTLPKLAKILNASPNLLSEAINRKGGLNFSDFINSYRIKETQRLLQSPEWQDQKIAAIAYEVGFNSLSVFNTAFKKFTGQTPSAYRKNILSA
ncbi:helix-turn-helix domain-containing protein [Chryseolinea sp. H1M3-3]|uniref:helix-turn-helix domain-containing protein n=1 Tax=Chryseolinea sp. H1M3-3 TaxID=3034144 RepID=UPI0023EAB1CE|nr:helix-turn-helix domain-containing protein [Chryseolinea sp. H1M3-3]